MRDRLLLWITGILRRNWVTLALALCLVSVLLLSLADAHWVAEDAPLRQAFLAGLLTGWLLARSRFPGWFAALYAALLSVAVILEAVGHILPSLSDLFSQSAAGLLDGMNLRAVAFYLRATGWVATYQAGSNIQDNGLFVLLLGFVLALCGVWLVWALARMRHAVAGLLPLGLLLAVNVHLSRQSLGYFMVFLACALLLAAREAFNSQQEDWQRRGVDYPEYLGLDWAGGAAALALVIVLLARAAAFFGTGEGWRVLSDWTQRTQQNTSNTATRLFSGVNPPPPAPGQKIEVFANTPDVGQVGDPISQSDTTIMWVSLSDPLPPPPGVSQQISAGVPIHYWRGAIFAAYTGRGWTPAPLDAASPPVEAVQPLPGRYFLTQTFDLQANARGDLFAANDPFHASAGVSLAAALSGDSRLLRGDLPKYQVVSQATRVTVRQLTGAPRDYPAAIRAAYLQLPGSLPARVRSLAERVTAGASDPYQKALAVQNYLRKTYPYNLQVPPPPAGRDVVDYFLFDAPGGFCSHYASAMAVMLRSTGVPARVVTGYAMGEFDPDRQAYRVPASAAHAWVEVYFPGYGWVEFEPTAVRAPFDYRAGGTGQVASAPPAAPGQSAAAGKTGQTFLVGLAVAAALLLVALPLALLRLFRQASRPAPVQVDSLYRRMQRALGWAGCAALPSLTPDEYLARYAGRLQAYASLSQALRQVTALYREASYSAHAPDAARVRRAGQLWQASLREYLALWLRSAWERLRIGLR